MNENNPIESIPMRQNRQGEWMQSQQTEPLSSYTLVLQEQEAKPHYLALLMRLERLKLNQLKKL